jgi:hypothetical protein
MQGGFTHLQLRDHMPRRGMHVIDFESNHRLLIRIVLVKEA